MPPLSQRPALFMRLFEGVGPAPAESVFASPQWAQVFSAAEEGFLLGLLKGVEMEQLYPAQFPKNGALRAFLFWRCEHFVFWYLGGNAVFAEGRLEMLEHMARVASKTATTGFTDALGHLVFNLPFAHLAQEDQRRKGTPEAVPEREAQASDDAYVWYGSGIELAFWLARTARQRLLNRDELWEKASRLFVKPDGTRFKANTLAGYASKRDFFEDDPIRPKDGHAFDELEGLGSGDGG